MSFHSAPWRLAAAAFVLLPHAGHAAITSHATSSAFNAATSARAVDTFAGLYATESIPSPSARTAGGYGYAASSPGGLYGSGSALDSWLSTKLSGDTLTFSGFSGGVQAIGGLFFGSDYLDEFLPGQTLTLTAVDSLGATSTQTLSNATQSSFMGFVSTGTLVSLTVGVGLNSAFVAADNLTLAQAVPEPASALLLLAGLGAVVAGAVRQRRGARF